MRHYNGNFITKTRTVPTSSAASGIWKLESQLIDKAASRWPVSPEPVDGQIDGDPTADFVEFSRRFIESDTYMSGSFFGSNADYDGNYDVTQVTVPATFSGSARLYLGHKNHVISSGATYFGDCPVAAIQILNSAGTSLLESWVFNDTNDTGWRNLNDNSTYISGTSTYGFPESLATSAARTYSSSNYSASSNLHYNFSLATSTGSSYTGCADGISDTFKTSGDGGSDTILTLGTATTAQSSNTYYYYHETSGTNRYQSALIRSPAYTFSGGEQIRIAHAVTGYSAQPMDPNDVLYIGVA